MNSRARAVRRDTGWIAYSMLAPPLTTALVRAAAPGLFEPLDLGLAFPQPSGRIADAGPILLNNARVLALFVSFAVLSWSIPGYANGAAVILAATVCFNVGLICVGVADGGARALSALLPHGPFEALAFSLAGAGFLHARREGREADLGLVIGLAGVALVLLAFAAWLEVTPT